MVHPTAVIYPCVDIGENVYIGAGCIIGAPPEHKAFWDKPSLYKVIIKSGTIVTGNVCIDQGTTSDTIIGKDCFIMKGAYIAHDCKIGDGVVISAGVSLAGNVHIGDFTNLGMNSSVHQHLKVPSKCMIGMGATIIRKTELEEGGVYVGNPAKFIRWNQR